MRRFLSRSAIALFACAPTLALAAASVDPDRLAVNVSPSDGSAVKADANLNAGTPDFQSSLQLTIEADPKFPGADPLQQGAAAAASHESVGLKTSWIAPEAVQIDLSFADRFDQTWRMATLGLVNDHQVSADDRSAGIGLSFSPMNAIDLKLTGAAAQKTVLDTALAEAVTSEPRSQLSTQTQSVGGDLKWRPTRWLSLDASARIEAADASWRGAPAGGALTGSSLSYADFEPSLTGSLSTPGKGALSLTFEHAISPLDVGAFSTFAAVEDRAADARIGPNREWRYRLRLDQKLVGDIQLSAALTEARIETATELGPVGPDLQAPVSISGGERQEMDLSLTAPLAALGLPSFTLKGAGAWKDSQVRDPFTGELRRASAESPQVASVDLVQSLPGEGAQWGLEGRFGGDQSLYQMSQVTNVSVADSLGGFVEYRPGDFAVRLQVDGLYGGERTSTDLYYAGTRATGLVDRTDHRTDDGQAVRLILSKAL